MAKARASRTKTALHDAMATAAASGAASSRAVVNTIKGSRVGREAIEAEREEIMDLGLMTLAGRIAARPLPATGQGDLFSEGRFKEFTDVRKSEPGSAPVDRVRTIDITMEQWFAQPPRLKKQGAVKRTNEDVVDAYFKKAQKEGYPSDTTLKKYLRID